MVGQDGKKALHGGGAVREGVVEPTAGLNILIAIAVGHEP